MSLPFAAHDDLLNFFMDGRTPEEIIAFKVSKESNKRLEQLVQRKKEGKLTSEEQDEIEQFEWLEHIFIIAKARAREQLQS